MTAVSRADAILRVVCHRHRLSPAETEEFRAHVTRRLSDGGAAGLGKRRHRSRRQTYLAILVERWYVEYLTRVSGRWRPSAEACRLGPTAIRLEALMTRDGLDFDRACRSLRTDQSVSLTDAELSGVAALLCCPGRPRGSGVRTDRTCLDAELLANYIDGRGAKDARALVETHLAHCQACCFVLSEAVQINWTTGAAGSRAPQSITSRAATARRRPARHRVPAPQTPTG